MDVLPTYERTGLNASKPRLHLCPVPCRRSPQADPKHRLLTRLPGILVRNNLRCSRWRTTRRERGLRTFYLPAGGQTQPAGQTLGAVWSAALAIRTPSRREFWAGRGSFLSAALLADATGFLQRLPCRYAPSAGARRVSRPAAVVAQRDPRSRRSDAMPRGE